MNPEIITLCGSTRFYKEFQHANYILTMQGYIVLSVGFYYYSSKEAHGKKWNCTPKQKIMLDELHFRKIDISNKIFVLNVNGYIGESTRNEINYAKKKGIKIIYLEVK